MNNPPPRLPPVQLRTPPESTPNSAPRVLGEELFTFAHPKFIKEDNGGTSLNLIGVE